MENEIAASRERLYDPSVTYRIHFAGDAPELIYEAEWDSEWECWCILPDDIHVLDTGDGLPETDMVEATS